MGSKKEDPERGMEAKANDPRATPVRGGLMHRFLSLEARMEKLETRVKLEEKKTKKLLQLDPFTMPKIKV